MQITTVPLDSLIEDSKNARLHPDTNLAAIEKSLQSFGQVEPLVVRAGTSVVIGGNGRLKVMRKLGWTKAHVVRLELTDEKAAALGVTLNRSGELARWDEKQLAFILSGLQDGNYDLEGLGYNQVEVDKLISTLAPPPLDIGGTGGINLDNLNPSSEGASHVRMVQLYLDTDTIDEFHEIIEELAAGYETENTTDTVMEALREIASRPSSPQ